MQVVKEKKFENFSTCKLNAHQIVARMPRKELLDGRSSFLGIRANGTAQIVTNDQV